MLSAITTFIPESLKGLLFSTRSSKLFELEKEIQKGNSPNRIDLLITRTAQIGFLHLSELYNEEHNKENQAFFSSPQQSYARLLGIINLVLLGIFEVFYRLVRRKRAHNTVAKAIFPVLQNVDRHFSKFLYFASYPIIILSFSISSWLVPLTFLFFNGIYYIQSKNLYSQKTKSQIDLFLFWSSVIAAFVFGHWFDKLFFAIYTIDRFSPVLEKVTNYIIGKIIKQNPRILPLRIKQQFKILADRLNPYESPPFKIQTTFDSFYQTIQGLAVNPHLKVSKFYVQNSKDTLPPIIDNINSRLLLQIFDSKELELVWDQYDADIVHTIKQDWHLSEADIDFNNKQHLRNLMCQGLKNYIDHILDGTLPGTYAGSEVRLKRYLDNITDNMQKLMAIKQYDLVVLNLIKLGIEGGNNCSIAKGRVLEEVYRNLVERNVSGNYSPSLRVANILQNNREAFFHEHLCQTWFIGFHPKCLFNLMFDSQDVHGYNLMVEAEAPRLGLPCLSAKIDMVTHFEKGKFIHSLFSRCEQKFWLRTTTTSILGEIQAAITGSHQFKATDIQRWYESFLDKHQIGTKSEQEDIMQEYEPGKAILAMENGHFIMNPDHLALMLLDMGVLYLENESESESESENELSPTFVPGARVNTLSKKLNIDTSKRHNNSPRR